ncbi:MAG: hypothetical protein JWP91_1948 [Fibrobacteres bacterium]|nr:hypothetical protein [Fibrobacterota bacterium]
MDRRLNRKATSPPAIERVRNLLRAAALGAASLLSGCLYTTHHFNSGRILEPGKTAVTFGLGRSEIYDQDCPETYVRSPDDASHCERILGGPSGIEGPPVAADTNRVPMEVTHVTIPKFSLSYRLGVRGPWGPFTGVEMGWQVEAVTNPGTIEFDLKFGLPIPKRFSAQHSVSGGWGVGMWADNSWFLEYAASRNFGKHALYGNYRYTWLASQPADINSSFDNWKFVSHRHYAHQAALGAYLRLPDWTLVPDFITPQVIFTAPITPALSVISPSLLDPFSMNFNFGFGWNF